MVKSQKIRTGEYLIKDGEITQVIEAEALLKEYDEALEKYYEALDEECEELVKLSKRRSQITRIKQRLQAELKRIGSKKDNFLFDQKENNLKVKLLDKFRDKNVLSGGLSDEMKYSFLQVEDLIQLRRGMGVEAEHSDNPVIVRKISLDHIAEFFNYYIPYLRDMEAEMKKEGLERLSHGTYPLEAQPIPIREILAMYHVSPDILQRFAENINKIQNKKGNRKIQAIFVSQTKGLVMVFYGYDFFKLQDTLNKLNVNDVKQILVCEDFEFEVMGIDEFLDIIKGKGRKSIKHLPNMIEKNNGEFTVEFGTQKGGRDETMVFPDECVSKECKEIVGNIPQPVRREKGEKMYLGFQVEDEDPEGLSSLKELRLIIKQIREDHELKVIDIDKAIQRLNVFHAIIKRTKKGEFSDPDVKIIAINYLKEKHEEFKEIKRKEKKFKKIKGISDEFLTISDEQYDKWKKAGFTREEAEAWRDIRVFDPKHVEKLREDHDIEDIEEAKIWLERNFPKKEVKEITDEAFKEFENIFELNLLPSALPPEEEPLPPIDFTDADAIRGLIWDTRDRTNTERGVPTTAHVRAIMSGLRILEKELLKNRAEATELSRDARIDQRSDPRWVAIRERQALLEAKSDALIQLMEDYELG